MPYTGTLPITKLSEADISRCSLWWDGFNVDSSDYNFQELSLISDWMHAVMLAEGWPFR